ncbi:hypothetical protein [Phaeovulum sp. W22_SRMD_FR3]|uniref:hypothetical protein n=1 Tax=Phaeovulum sp. W22_SRMD_FR3 TaxID=3240274 RepID=UPI003F946725
MGLALFGIWLTAVPARADLVSCDTSIRGTSQSFVYDPENAALKDAQSRRERLLGDRGAITCPGLVSLRVLTPELTDAERGPFCLQWDRKEKTYIGYAEGERDAYLICKTPSKSVCERVNASKRAAARISGNAADFATGAGLRAVMTPSGAVVLNGSGQLLGEQLAGLGVSAMSTLSAPAVLTAAAVSAVAVGGAVYVCSDNGAEGAAVVAAPAAAEMPDGSLASGVPATMGSMPGSDLPATSPFIGPERPVAPAVTEPVAPEPAPPLSAIRGGDPAQP